MQSTIKKRTVLFLFSLFVAGASYAQWNSVKGNGNMTTVTRTTGDYDGIKCAGNMDFVLVSGNEGQIKIEGEENLMEYIVTEVKGSNLIVKVKNGKTLKSSKGKTIKVTIPFEAISKVSLAGSGDLWNESPISASDLDVSLAGSGDIVLDVKATSAKGAVAGSGDLTLKGSTNNLEVKVAGSGDFHGFSLESNNTEVSIAGSGDAKVVSNESIKGRVAGSGDIVYRGNPEKEDNKVAGSGTIKAN
ncbi:head GIN domain-containing protein [Seonamhaeicola sp.]|uniref:head GIN domain-containing protein n=1 Tax=Seonamhaeicola sp. TaxID=1912245 RepID=UPI00261C7B60|nr:head GIN domain-containing protein [Seonamhaeicola sp.]